MLKHFVIKLSGYLKSSKVRQVLADLALSQVAHKRVEYLNISEARRLAIGIQLVRDPGERNFIHFLLRRKLLRIF